MGETEWLAQRFEQHRPRLRAVAYRMLGSLTEADDAVQYGRPFSVIAFTVVEGRIVQIDGIRDPDRVRRLAATVLPGMG